MARRRGSLQQVELAGEDGHCYSIHILMADMSSWHKQIVVSFPIRNLLAGNVLRGVLTNIFFYWSLHLSNALITTHQFTVGDSSDYPGSMMWRLCLSHTPEPGSNLKANLTQPARRHRPEGGYQRLAGGSARQALADHNPLPSRRCGASTRGR